MENPTVEKKKVDAVYDDELLEMLENLRLKTKFENGKLSCAFCKDMVSWNNLHSIFPHGGIIKVCCTNPECVNNLIAVFR